MSCQREIVRRVKLWFAVLTLSLLLTSCAYEQKNIPSSTEPTAAKEEAPKAVRLDDLKVVEQDMAFQVVLTGSQPLAYVSFQLSTPPEIIVDLPATELNLPLDPVVLNNSTIKEIKKAAVEGDGQKFARITIELQKPGNYRVRQEGIILLIDIDKAGAKGEQAAQEKAAVKAETKATEIKNLLINQQKEGLQVVIQANGEIEKYSTFTLSNPNRLVIDVNDVAYIPAEKSIKVESPFIRRIRVGKDEQKVRFVVEFTEVVPPFQVTKSVEKLILSVGKISSEKAVEEKTAEIKPEVKPGEPSPEEKAEEPVKRAEKKAGEEKPAAQYTGQNIALDFKDADIKNVLRLIADACNYNIITSDNVKGKVTIKLKDVPCDQVMDIILDTNSLGKIMMGNVLRIDTNAAIKEIEQARYEARSASLQMEDLATEIIDINFAKAKDLKKILEDEKHLFSDRGSAVADDRTNKLIVQDVEKRVEWIKARIQLLDQPTRQVLIETRIVQANPTYTKELGVQWGGTYNTKSGDDKMTFKGIAGEQGQTPYVVNLPAPVSQGSGGGFNFGMITDSLSLDVALSALEKDEKLKIISNPKILGLDNKECVIKQGVQLPYLKLSEQGVTSTEFKDAVLEIKATPHIASSGNVIIHLEVKKDQKSAQTGAGGEPGIDTRQAITDLLVEDGKTVVIGGIYEETVTHNVSGVPYFMKLPLIGRFFRNVSDKLEKTELLIFLTVTVVRNKPLA
ncbi:MAG TPA: type IV pilus secretin PilQ [Thermodesulfobacteriota bacterium]|nr:type IV pilus secretin PilQ [Thermodesulfobacteriota bacterium]